MNKKKPKQLDRALIAMKKLGPVPDHISPKSTKRALTASSLMRVDRGGHARVVELTEARMEPECSLALRDSRLSLSLPVT